MDFEDVSRVVGGFDIVSWVRQLKERGGRKDTHIEYFDQDKEDFDQDKEDFEAQVTWELYQLKFKSRITNYFTGERVKKAEVLFKTCSDWETLQTKVKELDQGYQRQVVGHYGEYDDLPAPLKPRPGDSGMVTRARERAQEIFDNDREGYFEEEEDV